MSLRAAALIGSLLLVGLDRGNRVCADDITAVDGTAFKNAAVIQYEPGGIIVKHDGGTNRIAWKNLPAQARQRYQAEARKQKEEEIQKLKQDLARAEAEAARLREDNAQSEGLNHPPSAKSAKATKPRAAETAAAPATELPPVNPDDVLDAAELVQQFKSDPSAAARRYQGKTLRVRGVIERFEPKLFIRKYEILLESSERFLRVVATFDYPDDYRAVYTTQRGQTLAGKPAENKEVVLMRAGQTVVLQGKCKGGRDTDIAFAGCRLISSSGP